MGFLKSALNSIYLFFFRKRLYSLLFRVFIGPFLMGFLIILVIFLVWQLLKYRDDFAGKGLDLTVYTQLISYLAIGLVPRTLPLAVMVSSLFTYGNLGEHNELVAIKSAGVSLVRLLLPIFFFVSTITVGSYVYQNEVMTWSNLKMYRLLWDIRQKDAAFNLTEGVFYNGLDGYRIKVEQKNPESGVLYDVMIYDHSEGVGNTEVVLADSGMMRVNDAETMMILDLYAGSRFAEHYPDGVNKGQKFSKSYFNKSVMNFDLTGLKMKNTPEDLFKSNRFMLDVDQLAYVADSLQRDSEYQVHSFDSVANGHLEGVFVFQDKESYPKLASRPLGAVQLEQSLKTAYAITNSLRYKAERVNAVIAGKDRDAVKVRVELIHRFTEALACLLLFLIGAPIGAVIKRGGIGVPAGLTIGFFILYYVLTITFEKYARSGDIGYEVGGWGAVAILLPIGLYFVYKAYNDARIFELNDKLNPWWYYRTRVKKAALLRVSGMSKSEMILFSNDYEKHGLKFLERSVIIRYVISKFSMSPLEVEESNVRDGLDKQRLQEEVRTMKIQSLIGIICLLLPIGAKILVGSWALLGFVPLIIGVVLSFKVLAGIRSISGHFIRKKLLEPDSVIVWVAFFLLGGLVFAPFGVFLFKKSKLEQLIRDM